MENTSEVIDSNTNYHLIKLLIGQLSQSQQERLKQEIISAEPTENPVPAEMKNPLTGRELQVLTLITDGYTRKEVGELLNISHNTVSCHVAHVYDKLHVSTIAEATRTALRLGILDGQTNIRSTRASRRAGHGLQSFTA